MAEASIPVDLFNPGQVFGCLGLLEASEVLVGDAEGGFDWSDPGRVVFRLRAAGEENPVREVLAFLAEADVTAWLADAEAFDIARWGKPARKDKPAEAFSISGWEAKWNARIRQVPGPVFPFPFPDGTDVLPALLEARGRRLVVDHWGDATRRDPFKLWAGAGGMPGVAILTRALEPVRPKLRDDLEAIADDPFGLAERLPSGFRLDWRRDYVALDIGFSPNDHSAITMLGFPLVEVLAVIGLQNARPQRLSHLEYRYAVAAGLLPPALLRAALGAADLPLAMRRFRMRLGWPGQEGQARCILEAFEERAP